MATNTEPVTADRQGTARDGELVFLGPNLQYFSNCHSLTVRWTLEHRAANPGSVPATSSSRTTRLSARRTSRTRA